MSNATAIIHAAPALGAGFLQYSAELEANGQLGPTSAQRFIYVIEGAITIELNGAHQLTPGGFAYIPQGIAHTVTSKSPARIAVIEKPYQPIDDLPAPGPYIGEESTIAPQPLMGDEALQVRALIPDQLAFDFAVNLMEYQPGAALSLTEMHVMEHGLLMLSGGGIYRLGDDWYPVTAGDFIWIAAFCPQWFGCIGKQPAKYLIYKDWNRSPL
jgi:(S)-ureidoglycine aminohydrolase